MERQGAVKGKVHCACQIVPTWNATGKTALGELLVLGEPPWLVPRTKLQELSGVKAPVNGNRSGGKKFPGQIVHCGGNVVHDIPLDEGCPILHLEKHFPTKFSSSTPAWKFLDIIDSFIIWLRCV